MNGRKALRSGALGLVVAMFALLQGASAADRVRFGTNWLAQAEHGGFYQALVDGTYAKYGIDLEIVQGGPQVNNRLLLPSGRIDFYMGGNMVQAFSAVEQNIPTLVVAAAFQKDPQIFMSHPGQGRDSFASLVGAPLFIGKDLMATAFPWLRATFGFREEDTRPYTFNPAPFIANKASVQQGYLTSEPFSVEQQAKFRPNVFLLADQGFDTYSTTIETRRDLVDRKPDLVQRFVDASIIGWYNYMNGETTAANAAIKRDNPDMTDAQLAFSLARMKEYGIVDSGDSLTLGIGAMTDERQKSFFDKMTKTGVLPATIDYRKAYTLRFVNKRVGLELRKSP
ncbi:MAG: nitrate transporter substrate-binding protein [Hyphomicrobiales bacterium]|nr:nitrate transporter substrate-binding protein [Hyphomicrobiales bacterium]